MKIIQMIKDAILKENTYKRFTKEHIEYMINSAKAYNGMENRRYKLVRTAVDDDRMNGIVLVDKKNKKVLDWGNARVPSRVSDIVNKFNQISGRKF